MIEILELFPFSLIRILFILECKQGSEIENGSDSMNPDSITGIQT